jgi:NTE family protein
MYGLVLEGGGGKGSFQIGACKALTELGIEISAVAGTSVGALNGAMVVQGEIDKAYDLWYDINPYSVINLAEIDLSGFSETGFSTENLRMLIKRVKRIIAERGLDTQPLINMVRNVIDEDKIRKSPVDFGMVTVDLSARKFVEIYKEDIPDGLLADYVIASASFPAFKRAMIDGRIFIDGSFYNALPINMISAKGCTDIIVLRTYSIGIKRHMDTKGLNLISISPSENLGPILDFSCERARKNLKMGYFDVLKVFRKLKGKKYYISPLNDDSFFINYLSGMSEKKVHRLCELFGLEESAGRRVIFEFLVPRVADLLGLPDNSSYEDVAIGLLEKIAGTCGVERFKIYSAEGLYSEIAGRYRCLNDEFIRDIPGFLRSRELLSRFVSERIISSIAHELFGNEDVG